MITRVPGLAGGSCEGRALRLGYIFDLIVKKLARKLTILIMILMLKKEGRKR